MRRKDREITDFQKMLNILKQCDILRLGLADGNFPYIVPVNFAYTVENQQVKFYIHGAMSGRKYQLMQKQKQCSFELDLPLKIACLPETKSITMYYRSIMGTAKIRFLSDSEKQLALEQIFLNRYDETRNFDYHKTALERTAVAELTVLNWTAKSNPPETNTN